MLREGRKYGGVLPPLPRIDICHTIDIIGLTVFAPVTGHAKSGKVVRVETQRIVQSSERHDVIHLGGEHP